MESAEFISARVTSRGNTLTVSHGGDENLIVVFYIEAVHQTAASEQAGRPIYQDVPFIWIRFPGDRTREIKRRANAEYIARFPRQWAAFQQQQTQVQVGTPLEEWPQISKSAVLGYKGVNVHTVENLAAVPDTALHNLGHGARDMRDKAIAWLKVSKDQAETGRLAAENAHLRDEIDMLKAQVAEIAATKRGPGRPRKERADEDSSE